MLQPSLKEGDEWASRHSRHVSADSELLTAITAELSAIGAATDLGLISQEGERASTVLVIDERRFCLTIEPAPADMLRDLQ